jgi:hypothetical protein
VANERIGEGAAEPATNLAADIRAGLLVYLRARQRG